MSIAKLIEPVMRKFHISLKNLTEFDIDTEKPGTYGMGLHDRSNNSIAVRIRAYDDSSKFLPKEVIMDITLFEYVSFYVQIFEIQF